MFKEFRNFLLRGNVVDLAVAVVIGAAFAAVIASFTENLLTPLIAIPGSVDFSHLKFDISGSTFRYGVFLNALITFVITAAAIFFCVVKPVNMLMERRKTQPDVDSPTKQCPECLSNIPTAARRCAFCTTQVAT
ncbi:MAG TPA: large conductance mechanosensitive channel protein MscL [Actinomycetota bacterium]|nr:large conductance mechanosensitive channel protein MscL [Actinomycetota bacterium]